MYLAPSFDLIKNDMLQEKWEAIQTFLFPFITAFISFQQTKQQLHNNTIKEQYLNTVNPPQ